MAFNVKMTGPPTLAAEPPPAVVDPRQLTCYASGSLCPRQEFLSIQIHLFRMLILAWTRRNTLQVRL